MSDLQSFILPCTLLLDNKKTMLRRLLPLLRLSRRRFSTKGQRVVISEFGNDPIDALENYYQVEEFESPDPASLGPDDVLIKIKACAVSWVSNGDSLVFK